MSMFGREEKSEKEKTSGVVYCLGCDWEAQSKEINPRRISDEIASELKRMADGHYKELTDVPVVVEGGDYRHLRIRVITPQGAIADSQDYESKFNSSNPPKKSGLN